ncbi:MAG: DUF4838 domain-containing protein [Saprospiraceae bacterium]
MKYILAILCILLLNGACKQNKQNLIITNNGITRYRIIYSANASDSLKEAINAFKNSLKLMTEVELSSFADIVGTSDEEILIGKSNRLNKYENSIPYKELGSTGYFTKTADKKWIITGNTTTAIFNALYDIINRLGSLKLTEGMTQYSSRKNLAILSDPGTKIIPSFNFRQTLNPQSSNAEYRNWNKINVDNEKDWGTWGYSLERILAAPSYFKTHPEYYAQIGNDRSPNQINFSDTSSEIALRKNLDVWSMAKGRALYWSISPYPNHIVSEDAKTLNTIKETGSAAGAPLKVANAVALLNKEKIYSVWLDGPYRKACTTFSLEPNVMLVLDTKDTDHGVSLGEGNANETFRKDLSDWKKITSNIAVYLHLTNEENYLMPFPNLHALQKTLHYLHDQGVEKVILGGDSGSGTSFSDLKFYVASNLAYNVNENVDSLIWKYCDFSYGKAASSMNGYIQALERSIQSSKSKLAYNAEPSSAYRSWLTPAIINQLYTYFNNIITLTQNDSELREKIEKERLGLIYTQLEVAKCMGTKTFGYFMNVGALRSQLVKADQPTGQAKKEIELATQKAQWRSIQGMKDLLGQFATSCETIGIKTIDSKGTTPQQFKDLTLKFLDQSVEMHLGFKKGELTFNTSPDPEFADGDPSVLEDGLYGIEESPKTNWLALKGGEGEVTWDYGKDTTISSLSVRFLQSLAARAWIPTSATCLVSNDGKSFTEVKKSAISSSNASSLIVSQNFNFGKKSIRFIKLKTSSKATCPADHPLSGDPAVVLLDEFVVK